MNRLDPRDREPDTPEYPVPLRQILCNDMDRLGLTDEDCRDLPDPEPDEDDNK